MLRLYNTLTQTKEPLQTVVPGRVGMYVCGPTVYSNSHVGHMVGPVIFDTIKKYLVYSGYAVTWVVNITDVDDKLILRVQEEGATEGDMAARVKDFYLDRYHKSAEQLAKALRELVGHGEIVKWPNFLDSEIPSVGSSDCL